MNTTVKPAEQEPVLMQEAQLRVFVLTATALRLSARFHGSCYTLQIAIGDAHFLLGSSRGEIRKFVTLDTLAGTVARLGAMDFMVNVGDLKDAQKDRESLKSSTKVTPSKPKKSASVERKKRQ